MNEIIALIITFNNQVTNNFRHFTLLLAVIGLVVIPSEKSKANIQTLQPIILTKNNLLTQNKFSTKIKSAHKKEHSTKDLKKEKSPEELCAPLMEPVVNWFVSEQDTPNPIENQLGPIRNQETEAACFAIATADLISSKIQTPISSSDLLAQYFKNPDNEKLYKDTHGGSITKLIKEIKGRFVCDENSWPFKPSREGILLNSNIQDYKYLKCSKEANIYLQSFELKPFKIKNKIGIDTLDDVLKNEQIALLQYKRNFMSNRYIAENSNHASTVIGRYFDQRAKTCRYIVRNTWGASCNKNVDPSIPCKKGYYAFSKDQIQENAYLGFYLDATNMKKLSSNN